MQCNHTEPALACQFSSSTGLVAQLDISGGHPALEEGARQWPMATGPPGRLLTTNVSNEELPVSAQLSCSNGVLGLGKE